MRIQPSNAGPKSPELTIAADEVDLFGELQVPAEARGVVLFAHGSGSSRHSPRNQHVARVLRNAGLGTLLFDLLTPEEEVEDADTGVFRFDVKLLAKRLLGATLWVEDQPETDGLKIGYFGSSTGGGAALMAAAALGDRVSAVVSRGGRPDLAGEALRNVVSPTLLIVGGLDDVVIQLNEQAMVRLHCEKELWIVPEATHLFPEPGKLDEVADVASEWFVNHMGDGG